MVDIEYLKYEHFVKENFPNSTVPNTRNMKKLYVIIQSNIRFMKLIKDIDKEQDKVRNELYETFYLLHLRVLYHLPSNDEFINKILIRTIVENILRLCASLLNCNIGSLKEASFNTLNNNLEGKGFQHRYKDLSNTLNNNFGTFSKDVHGENIHKLSEKEFLVSIRKADNIIHLERLLNVYKEINRAIIPFFLKEIRTTKSDLSGATLSVLLNIVGEDNYELFYNK
ncbi:hypothetical protein [Metabacillus halosaccharovorans]|uniref:hypothetical protein n=1 Tax=Metabacillus halosaccharovorans TaxID=930124 RepID=UPI001C1FB5EC|nr:hypothetical protein [Metabacillus halosaccharovorans]MBU7595727.1 hypothetical protein [Metabacillus halosaccharovorans]